MPQESASNGWAFRAMVAMAFVFGLSSAQASAAKESPAAQGSEADRAGFAFFETKIRPILAEHCYKCHAGERHKANLRLDSLRGMLTGGDSGPAIVPGDAEHSLLVQVIGYSDDYVQMPPTRKLPDKQIADLTRWVKQGAPGRGPTRATRRRRHGRPWRSPIRIELTGFTSRFAGHLRRKLNFEVGLATRSTPSYWLGWKPKNSNRMAKPTSGPSSVGLTST